jgi:hypothetical protein
LNRQQTSYVFGVTVEFEEKTQAHPDRVKLIDSFVLLTVRSGSRTISRYKEEVREYQYQDSTGRWQTALYFEHHQMLDSHFHYLYALVDPGFVNYAMGLLYLVFQDRLIIDVAEVVLAYLG